MRGTEYTEFGRRNQCPELARRRPQSGGAQTEQGIIVFDAPAKHYRLRLTDETDKGNRDRCAAELRA